MPSGWVQVLRGPRPPSVKWPPAREGSRTLPGRVAPTEREVVVTTVHTTSWRMRSTCWGDEPARTTVGRGIEGGPCEDDGAFQESARQRVVRADGVIARAVEQKEIYVKDVSEGESRLQTLMSEEVSVPAHVSPPDVQELQEQIDELRRERDLWRAAQTQIPRELQGMWCAGGPPNRPPRVARLDQRTQLRSQERIGVLKQCEDGLSSVKGTAQLAVGSRDVVMDGSTRSALMASQIEESNAKEVCCKVPTRRRCRPWWETKCEKLVTDECEWGKHPTRAPQVQGEKTCRGF